MPYELDFHPVGQGDNSGDAITLRYQDATGWHAIIIDGGFQDNGALICDHIQQVYGLNVVDHVISTHPDNDHICGLRTVMERLPVRNLWLHVPFIHAAQIAPLFSNPRWTVDGLATSIRRAYPVVEELIDLARQQGTQVFEPFQGDVIGPFTVLSPSVTMYEGLLPQFRDTPTPDQQMLATLGFWLTGIGRRVATQIRKIIPEDWNTETLREGGVTSAENESSVVLYGRLDDRGILLTADAGLKAMTASILWGVQNGFTFGETLRVFQVPHHGSRNNVSPTILNAVIGEPCAAGARATTSCVIAAGPDDTTHPRQVVVNALTRRGLRPLSTGRGPILIPSGVLLRAGFGPGQVLSFETRVEAYE